MPTDLSCPTCRHPVAVEESPTAYVVNCPTCRHPLTVPGSFTDRPEEPAPRTRRERYAPPRSPGRYVFHGLVLVLVAVACAVFLWGRAADSHDRARLKELRDRHADIQHEMIELQIKIDRGMPLATGDVRAQLGHGRYMSNRQYRDLFERLVPVVEEYNRICDAHPDWALRRLAVGIELD